MRRGGREGGIQRPCDGPFSRSGVCRSPCPRGETPAFALARHELHADHAEAAFIKDAGDDPDVTHGAQIIVDVARAAGLRHIAGATGSTSEEAVARLFGLDETALIDMGDFVGGMLRYVRKAPVDRVSIAGGFAKMTKLGQGLLDLHSRAGAVDLTWLASLAAEAAQIATFNLGLARPPRRPKRF